MTDFKKLVELTERIVDAEYDFKTAMEKSNDGWWDWYIKDDYEYMSPRFWEILGYDYTTKKSHPSEWQSIIFPEDLSIVLENFDKHIKSKGKIPFFQEVRYRHKNGSTVWVCCQGKVVEWDADDNPVRMIGTHTDLTAIKGAK